MGNKMEDPLVKRHSAFVDLKRKSKSFNRAISHNSP